MKDKALLCGIALMLTASAYAQRTGTDGMIQAMNPNYTQMLFRANTDISTVKIPEAPIEWGMDVAWNSSDNVKRGTNYIRKDVLATGRISFQPSDLVDAEGNLSAAQKKALQSRLTNISISGVKNVILNCDHEALNKTNYVGKPYEWYRVIKASILYAKSKGFNVVTVSPFNEPDYSSWGEGSKDDFKAIAKYISEDEELAGIRISAGNTLNCDQALSWYNYMKPYVTEGNTHQLAGAFNTYAKFWETVRADGNHATADELHNTMEAFVGIHYGMQTGVWWGWDGAARGELCRATYYGKEIGYAEDRASWTAASIYKRDNDRIDAFLGTSERQANTHTYEMVATDRPVYYDGHGPLYNYSMEMPGGTGYQNGQTNAERMVQIHYGEDVPVEPLDSASYVIMNINSQKVIGFLGGMADNGTQLIVGSYNTTNSNTHQRWIVSPVAPRSGGDFGYFYLRSERNKTQVMDLLNWGTSTGVTLCGYPGGLGANEQWFVEYAGNGNWYIRSRHSGLYLEARNTSTIKTAEFVGDDCQMWRFMPTDAARELKAPAAPSDLTATAHSGYVSLSWTASADADVAGYEVLRKEKGEELNEKSEEINEKGWDVIGRMIDGTEFVDNSLAGNTHYIYKVKAIDKSRNRSAASQPVEAMLSTDPELVAHYSFNQTLEDATGNMPDMKLYGKETFISSVKKEGTHALSLVGSASNYMMLMPSAVSHRSMTIALWFYNLGSSQTWSRIFDFGNGTSQYMFLTPNSGSDMRFVIKNGGEEQILTTSKPGGGFHHYAVTLCEDSVSIYLDGECVATSKDITIRPTDFRPVMNYIGRSQFASDPLLRGYIDDIRIYNYALSADDMKDMYEGKEITGIKTPVSDRMNNGVVYSIDGKSGNSGRIVIENGKKIIVK